MASIGERARLTVLRESSPGLFLDSEGDLGEVLLPGREIPPDWKKGDALDVFLYRDSEDIPVATLRHPKAMPGEFACLECVSVTGFGAFLDWGLPKDLFVSFREQKERLAPAKSYVVYVYVDAETDRIAATCRLSRHLSKEHPPYQDGEEVELLIHARTDLGYKAIVNSEHTGVIFANQVFRHLRIGEKTKGYVTQVRHDGKIDRALDPPGRKRIEDLEIRIEAELRRRGGFWHLCDSSPPEEIKRNLGVSKKAFKQATGALFRKRKITIEKDGIRAVAP